MEATVRYIVEATSWMDWWTFAMQSLAFKSTNDGRLVRRLFLAGARCQLLVVKTASTPWVNVILKRRDAVLTTVKDCMSFESFMDLRNSTISINKCRTWILFAMSAYSFDEPKFTSFRKRKRKKKTISKTPKFTNA